MNDDLIEQAKRAVSDYDISRAKRISPNPDRLAILLAEMVAVFEEARNSSSLNITEAHSSSVTASDAPTDDERLMQSPAIQAVRDMLDYYADEIGVHIWQEIASLVDDIPDCVSATAIPHEEHGELQTEPTIRDHVRELTGVTDEVLDELGGFQGEPTDAQVLAALNVFYGEPRAAHMWDRREDMRAALRAAAETTTSENGGAS